MSPNFILAAPLLIAHVLFIKGFFRDCGEAEGC